MSDKNPFGDLALRCPPIDVDEAATIARDLFGREGKVRELGSNQDRNYRVDAPDGRFVLKIANPGWERVALEAQNAAMSHLAASHLAFAVPVPVASPAGNLVEPLTRDGETFDVRLVTYVEGVPLDATPYRSAKALRATGRIAGETTRALADFDARRPRPHHPVGPPAGATRRRGARPLGAGGGPPSAGATAAGDGRVTLDPLARRAAAAGRARRHHRLQRHGDPRPPGRMMPTGLIDFGDLIHTWRISDIATAVQSLGARRPDARARGRGRGDPRLPRRRAAVGDRDRGGVAAGRSPAARSCAVCEEQQAILEPDNAVRAGVPRRRLGRRRRGWRRSRRRSRTRSLRAGARPGPSRHARAAAARLAEIGAAAGAARAGTCRPACSTCRCAATCCGSAPWAEPAASRRVAGRRGGRHRSLGGGPPRARPARAVRIHRPPCTSAPTCSSPRARRCRRRSRRRCPRRRLGCDARLRRRRRSGLAGIGPPSQYGHRLAAGDDRRHGGRAAPADPLPAHLHVQASPTPTSRRPGSPPPRTPRAGSRSPPTRRRCWAATRPRRRDDPAALARPPRRGRSRACRSTTTSSRPRSSAAGATTCTTPTAASYLDMVNNVAVLGHSHPPSSRPSRASCACSTPTRASTTT